VKPVSIVIAAAVIALIEVPAMAAPPPTPVPAAFSWAGLYIGVNVGGDWQRASSASTEIPGGHLGLIPLENVVGTGSDSSGDIAGGGQIGYNWQIKEFLLGVEADFDALSANPPTIGGGPFPASPTAFTFNLATTARADWLSTVRGRMGVAIDRTLIYATGGAAFARITISQTYSDALGTPQVLPTSLAFSSVQTGYAVGGGLEYALDNNWLLRAEYLYAGGFASKGGTYLGTSSASGNSDGHSFTGSLNNIQMVRTGLSYKFW
jgi:outer membrane immunogenic protein